ncbi:hypothetical protein N7539_005545 [Penicillium diatomitis]|uniref:Xylanolytic transcriptional activator regulatory domain-containing protein n=1 Tax=Penicillium diatomitis TaxID=2819901 RepID=A0A9W9X775_9EURO|nr:uncharacterized protein N7539_005545 [Penicillium diatomitis]KAJ5485557.1 hypothetical protein N7539_005545 [Penicillium diatomitis]
MPREGTRGRLRSHEACLNCRSVTKKNTLSRRKASLLELCAIESGVSLHPRDERFPERPLEEKVNLILSGGRTLSQDQGRGGNHDNQEAAYSAGSCASSAECGSSMNDPFLLGLGFEDSKISPSSRISQAIDLYFQYCHRQPIWCFDREEVKDTSYISEELVCSILTLTARFSTERDELLHYGDSARTLVMLRIANGTVELETIESLCLLSYSSFLDGNGHLARFHLGLALQLCRSAMLDLHSTYGIHCSSAERKKRLFWSLQCLDQTYGQIHDVLSVPAEVLRSFYVSSNDELTPFRDLDTRPPPFPMDEVGCTASSDLGIWSLALHFGWIWSRVRSYVFDCAQNRLKEPWRHDSLYTQVLSDVTELENKLSLCHRYDSVRFYERRAEEVRANPVYWAPWLKFQFTYHSILTVLNHPFLYIVASQYNHKLTIPNTFWRRSSELVLLHATWIVRLIDMVSEKKLRLIDPFFGHAAAIAATVHLYYCCAADPRLKFKSKTDFTKCRRFLKSFVSFSPACEKLNQTLDKMTRIASGSDKVDFDWEPSKILLSIPLMWELLQVNCTPTSQETAAAGLLHPSLSPAGARDEMEDLSSTLEIIVAMSPDITVNTTDGGSAAHLPPNLPQRRKSAPEPPVTTDGVDKLVAPADSLMTNTPWLWTEPPQFIDMDTLGYPESESALGSIDGFSTWWDYGNL